MSKESILKMYALINNEKFDEVDQLLTTGESVDGGSYTESCVSGWDAHESEETYNCNYLKDAFKARRLLLAEYLLARGANFTAVAGDILEDLTQSNLEFATKALQLLSLYQAKELLNLPVSGGNILHFISKERGCSGGFKIDAQYSRIFSFSLNQLQLFLDKLPLNKIAINKQNHEGSTSMHLAIKTQHTDMVTWLIKTGLVNLNLRDNSGMSVLDLAQNSNAEIKKMLSDYAQKLSAEGVNQGSKASVSQSSYGRFFSKVPQQNQIIPENLRDTSPQPG